MKIGVREYVEADAWLSIFSGAMGDHRPTIENAALWADKALKEFEKRYVEKDGDGVKYIILGRK